MKKNEHHYDVRIPDGSQSHRYMEDYVTIDTTYLGKYKGKEMSSVTIINFPPRAFPFRSNPLQYNNRGTSPCEERPLHCVKDEELRALNRKYYPGMSFEYLDYHVHRGRFSECDGLESILVPFIALSGMTREFVGINEDELTKHLGLINKLNKDFEKVFCEFRVEYSYELEKKAIEKGYLRIVEVDKKHKALAPTEKTLEIFCKRTSMAMGHEQK